MAIHLYFTDSTRDKNMQKPTGDELITYILTHNGDVVIDSPIKCTVKFKRNDIWYLTIKFPAKILNGRKLTTESIFKCDLGYVNNQLFRMIYPKYNRKEDTYECYCNHVFFDSRFECIPRGTDHKCDNTSDEPYKERWSWDKCIEQLNIIGTESAGKSYNYEVIGVSPEPEFFDTTPEVGELFYILWKYSPNTNKCWDVLNGDTGSGSPIGMYTRTGLVANRDGFNPAQVFALTPSKSGVDGEYNIRNYTSYLYTNINGAVAFDGATIMIYKDSKDAPHERFTFERLADGGCLIQAVIDPTFVISRGEANWNDAVQLCLRNKNQNKEAFTYVFSYVRHKVDIDFNEQNLIESLFGSSDNSMKKAFAKSIAKKHTTAMLNNYKCYFGDMTKYPEYLKPNEIVLSSRMITNDEVTDSTEDRIDAIIPIGMNDKRPPLTDDRSFVKALDYDKRSVHHVAQVKYDDIGLKADGGDLADEDALWEALAGRARADLESEGYAVNKTTSELSIIDVVKSGASSISKLKLNDTLYYENQNGSRDKYYIEEYQYDLTTNTITDISIVKEGEE